MSIKVLITGGAGYLGSVMIPDFLMKGYDVTVIDNFMYKQNSLNNMCINKNFNIVNGDVRIKDTMLPLITKADIIIPLAAFVGAPLCLKDPIGSSAINHEAIIMMLANMSSNQCVLMPTTNSAYGSGDENNFCTEESPLNPVSLYAKDKVIIEKKLLEKENVISFRLATVFGMSPRMRLDLLVNDFTYRAVKDGFLVLFESHFKRNYIHVKDVSRAFLHGIDNFKKMKGEIYNVGLSDANISKKELCDIIKKQVPNFVFPEQEVGFDPDQRNYIVSNKKIEQTNYKTTVGLSDGITELIKGYRMLNNSNYSNV
ncbi:SDR family oxidoreductase [Alphaproteobacteria bacterium]|jgi:nucleoside-diphosphate-sugar epimerase|nr:SDR family oxidoreductase [Alphaproteobacteria bacterium]